MADRSVRAAGEDDAEAVAAVQAAAWRTAYHRVLPAYLLDGLDGPEARQRWRQAVTDPPSPRHRLLVACAGADVVGMAAFGPAQDPDLDPEVDAEVHVLAVDPAVARQGHGSRLLAAVVDHLRGDGFSRAHMWLLPSDTALERLLSATGWGPDGTRRTADLRGDGEVVLGQVRMHTGLDAEPVV